jgi:hypothetical protein
MPMSNLRITEEGIVDHWEIYNLEDVVLDSKVLSILKGDMEDYLSCGLLS